MNIFKATADFEHWLAGQLPILRQDLALKHQHMAEATFPFLHATSYRWLQIWPGSIKPQRPCWRPPKKIGNSGSAIGSAPRRVRRSRKTCPH